MHIWNLAGAATIYHHACIPRRVRQRCTNVYPQFAVRRYVLGPILYRTKTDELWVYILVHLCLTLWGIPA